MNCTKCGAENAPDSKFCFSCGAALVQEEAPVTPVEEPVEAPVEATPVEAAPVETEAAPAEAAAPAETVATAEAPSGAVDLNAVKTQLADTVNPIFAKIKPYLTNKKVLIGIAAAVVVLIAVSLISVLLSGNNGYVELKQYVMPTNNGDEINIIVDKKVLSDTVESDGVDDGGYSLDGKVTAFTTDEGELYVVNGKKMKKVAEDVYDFEISVSGKALAYVVDEDEGYSLTLYSVGNGKKTDVTDEMSSLNYAISPDGKSVAYYVEGDDNDELMFFKGSKSVKVTANESELVGLSNNGKHIYVISENDDDETVLYSYNTKGDRKKLGTIGSGSVRFNDDHTQVMFYNEGKTYISTKGKDAVKASSDQLYLLIAPNSRSISDSNSTTYPVSDLYNHVYTCSDGETTSAWMIKKNADKSVKLVSKAYGCKLDASAEYLYYIYNNEELRVIKISDGDKASERFKTLAEDVSNYVVTSDRDLVYFISDETLYSVNGKKGGRPKTISNDDVDYSLALNGKDVAYYIMDGDLYACSNGKKGSKVVSDVEGLISTPNGIVYAGNEDVMYATNGAKKPSKILTLD